jgi:hypothetical protein
VARTVWGRVSDPSGRAQLDKFGFELEFGPANLSSSRSTGQPREAVPTWFGKGAERIDQA